jgi:hypothetical protein
MATGVRYGHIIKHLETFHLDSIPIPTVADATAADFAARATDLGSGRRRLEAAYHSPQAQAILRRFKKKDRLGDIARVWRKSRSKRFYGERGIPYLRGRWSSGHSAACAPL